MLQSRHRQRVIQEIRPLGRRCRDRGAVQNDDDRTARKMDSTLTSLFPLGRCTMGDPRHPPHFPRMICCAVLRRQGSRHRLRRRRIPKFLVIVTSPRHATGLREILELAAHTLVGMRLAWLQHIA